MSTEKIIKRSSFLDRREFIRTSCTTALLLVARGSSAAMVNSTGHIASGKTRPNILVILTDQQHIESISAAGCKYADTPAMDSLVKNGLRFTQSYSTNPVCSPARSSIVTGRMTTETGVPVNGRRIRKDIPNLGQWFTQESDYECLYAGKWHIPQTHPTSIDGFRILSTGIGGHGILGDTSVSRACEGFLYNRPKSRPFLMVSSFLQPHDICEWLRLNMIDPGHLPYKELAGKLPPLPDNFEYDAREPEHLKSQRGTREPEMGKWSRQQWQYYLWSYYRHIEMVDGEIDRVLQALHHTGYDQNTFILLTSDHGEGLAHHQNVRKSQPYDEIARVPLIASWPGRIRRNETDSHLVSGVDIMPTLCGVAGIREPDRMRGQNLLPVMEGKSVPGHEFVVTELPGDRARMIRTEGYKYVTYKNDPLDMLFDMKNDPGETLNLAADIRFAPVVEEHRKLLVEWEKQLDVAPEMPGADAWWRKGL